MISIESLYAIYRKHSRISTDSRAIVPGSLFFALKGPAFNGNDFAEKSLEQGAAFAIVDEDRFSGNDRILQVPAVLTALQHLARFHRDRLEIPVLAITGSNGKTTTKELVRRVLAQKFRTQATLGNLNNHIGVPLTLLGIGKDIEFAVIEMGANHQHEIESYCKIAAPDYGLITNIGKAHLEGFGGIEGVKKGKGELYAWIAAHGKAVFINGDSDHLSGMADIHQVKNRIVYGTKKEFDCEGILFPGKAGLQVTWKYHDHTGEVRSQIIGNYNFENILAAVAVGNYFGVDPWAIDLAIAGYVPDNSRSQVITRGTNTIILDAYNANPTSMEAALKNFSAQPGEHKTVCIGDMAELGTESAEEHRRIIQLIRQEGFETVVLVGDQFGAFASDLNCFHFENSVKAADWIRKHPFTSRSILIKGSRSTQMEKILEAL